ncbi:hypothetical protein CBL_05397 [Carabus blaptoides fortunei]
MNFDNSSLNKLDDSANDIKRRAHLDIIEKERNAICERAALRYCTRLAHLAKTEKNCDAPGPNEGRNYNAVRLRIEQEEKLAKELSRLKREEIKEIKMRQQLRETSVELRELEAKLRCAYVTKELSAQLAEKEYLKMKQKEDEKLSNELIREALLTNAEAERIEAEEEFKRKVEYKKELQDQMILQYQQKQYMYEEFLKEKKLLDDIIQRIHDEDAREIEEKMYRLQRTKDEIDSFKAAQEIWRQKERQELEEENRRIEEFLREKEIKQRELNMQKNTEDAAKTKVTEELAMRIYVDELKRKEREEIVQDLLEEELKEKEDQKMKEEFRRQVDNRIEMQRVLARQLEERREKLRQEELEDARYKEQMIAKVIEDQKIEQMTAEKRRRKMMELRRDIEEHMQERRAKRAEELRQLLYLQEQDKLREENRRKVIEEERLRLLKEHASNLIGYLPPGVLRADDLPHLGSEFTNRFMS